MEIGDHNYSSLFIGKMKYVLAHSFFYETVVKISRTENFKYIKLPIANISLI